MKKYQLARNQQHSSIRPLCAYNADPCETRSTRFPINKVTSNSRIVSRGDTGNSGVSRFFVGVFVWCFSHRVANLMDLSLSGRPYPHNVDVEQKATHFFGRPRPTATAMACKTVRDSCWRSILVLNPRETSFSLEPPVMVHNCLPKSKLYALDPIEPLSRARRKPWQCSLGSPEITADFSLDEFVSDYDVATLKSGHYQLCDVSSRSASS